MYSQDGHPETNFRIVPVSPNAASLGTYGLIPTDNYDGASRTAFPFTRLTLTERSSPLHYRTIRTEHVLHKKLLGLALDGPSRQEGASSDKCRVRTTLQHVDAITLLMLRGWPIPDLKWPTRIWRSIWVISKVTMMPNLICFTSMQRTFGLHVFRRIEEQPTTECRPYHPNTRKSGKDGIQYK